MKSPPSAACVHAQRCVHCMTCMPCAPARRLGMRCDVLPCGLVRNPQKSEVASTRSREWRLNSSLNFCSFEISSRAAQEPSAHAACAWHIFGDFFFNPQPTDSSHQAKMRKFRPDFRSKLENGSFRAKTVGTPPSSPVQGASIVGGGLDQIG